MTKRPRAGMGRFVDRAGRDWVFYAGRWRKRPPPTGGKGHGPAVLRPVGNGGNDDKKR